MFKLWQPVKALTWSQKCESRCQMIFTVWCEDCKHFTLMCSVTWLEVCMISLQGVDTWVQENRQTQWDLVWYWNDTIHLWEILKKTVTIDCHNGAVSQALTCVIKRCGCSMTCHWVWAPWHDLQHWRLQWKHILECSWVVDVACLKSSCWLMDFLLEKWQTFVIAMCWVLAPWNPIGWRWDA